MNRKKIIRSTNFIVMMLFSLNCTSSFAADDAEHHSRVWISYNSGHDEKVKQLLNQTGAKIHYQFKNLNAYAATVPTAAIKGLSQNPNINLIEEDPKRYPVTDSVSDGIETIPYGIDSVQASKVWDSDNNGTIDADAPSGQGIKVCIIDSGLYADHEEFTGRGISGTSDPSGSGSWNKDNCGHGTHVAGTIAAANNALGVVGVSPNASLHIVKVFGNDNTPGCGWAYSSSLVDAANKCQGVGAKIISMSLGGSTKSRTEETAFRNLYNTNGILSVAAAGNAGNATSSYPASYKEVVSVAAVDEGDAIASFSQYNSQVELAAPGVEVLSTVPWKSTNTLTLTTTGITYSGYKIENSGVTDANGISGTLIDGGLCDSTAQSWGGAVVLCKRGDYSFYDKVTNVQNNGGTAAVIYNNVAGGFSGTLGDGNSSSIPAISLSQENGGTITGSIGSPSTSTVVSFTVNGSGYEAWDGTSMSTPHVSGVAAAVWSAYPSKTNVEIRNALTATAKDLGPIGRDNAYGYGLVQAYNAWQSLGGGTPPPTPPTASFNYNCTDLSCDFNGAGSGGTIVSYAWGFGDGKTGAGNNINHSYTQAGSYPVKLTVTDDATLTGFSEQNIQVKDPSADNTAPLITNVSSQKTKGTKFKITWGTDEASDSVITLTCCGIYKNSSLTTSHSMEFTGSKGAQYEYFVSSTDAAGNTSATGFYMHIN